jgi:hypothetical protein
MKRENEERRKWRSMRELKLTHEKVRRRKRKIRMRENEENLRWWNERMKKNLKKRC